MVGFFAALLAAGLVGRQSALAGDGRSVEVRLSGQSERQCAGAPVYRRFRWMAIELDGVSPDEFNDLALVLESLDGTGQRRGHPTPLKHRAPLRPVEGRDRAQAAFRLMDEDQRPMPIGPYRIVVYRRDSDRIARVAQQTFYVIFNALEPADRAAHHWRAQHYLADEMQIMQKSEGEPHLYDWRLNIHTPPVFQLAIGTVAGARDPRSAVERVAKATTELLEGFWPELQDVNDHVPSAAPEKDEDWRAAAVRSIRAQLRWGDFRAQCFNYSAFSVALLRSIGLPATASSVMDPEIMEHPYNWERQVAWNFHVWTEVHIDGRWRAIDITYLDRHAEQSAPETPAPDLQPSDGPWFARMIGPESRVWRQKGPKVVDVTLRYRGPGGRGIQPPLNTHVLPRGGHGSKSLVRNARASGDTRPKRSRRGPAGASPFANNPG